MPLLAASAHVDAGPLVLDTTIVHPAGADIVAVAAQLDRIAAHVREAQKVDAYNKDVEKGVYDVAALALETCSAMATSTRRHLKRLGAIAAASGKISKGVFMRNTMLALSIALRRGNGFVIRKRMQEWSKAAGRQFVYGLLEPTAEL